jgi:hypothetical protein
MFVAHIGSTFDVQLPDGRQCSVVLEQVESLATGTEGRPHGFREPFALRFRAPHGAPGIDTICRVAHDVLGSHEMFLIAAAAGAGTVMYTAVFG